MTTTQITETPAKVGDLFIASDSRDWHTADGETGTHTWEILCEVVATSDCAIEWVRREIIAESGCPSFGSAPHAGSALYGVNHRR